MNWQGAVAVALLIALWLIVRRFNQKRAGNKAPGPPAADRQGPTMMEQSSALKGGLRDVTEAVDRCKKAQGDDDLAVRRRELAETLRDSVTAVRSRLAAEEMCKVAGPWLSVTLVVTEEGQATSVDHSEWQRNLWHRAEEMIAACAEARGDDLAAARERLRQFVSEIEASSEAFMAVVGLMSERSALMWRIAVEEIGSFAADALARQPEQRS